MPFEPAIERAAGEAQRLGRLAHVPAGARERLLDQDALDLLEAHLIERARAVGAGPKTKVAGAHAGALRHEDGALDRMLQLTHVPRPGMAQQHLHRVGRESIVQAFVVACGVAPEKMRREQRNVLPAIPQGRQSNLDGVEPEEQIFAEAAGFDFAVDVGEVKAGRFREDLLFRLNTVEIRLPPLRDRRQDIPLLAAHFLGRYAARYHKSLNDGFASDAMEVLLRHSWPGNVRELEHAVERAVLMSEGAGVRARDFGLGTGADGAGALDQMSLEEVERVLIQKALTRAGGNVSQAAESLGLSRSALYRRLKRHGL